MLAVAFGIYKPKNWSNDCLGTKIRYASPHSRALRVKNSVITVCLTQISEQVIAIGVHPDPQKPRVATASLGTSVAIHIWEATNPIAKPKKEVQDKTSR